MKVLKFVVVVFTTIVFFTNANSQKTSFYKYVNPFVSVHGNGNTHPAATLPYSVVSLGPDAEYPQSTSGYSTQPGGKFIGFSHIRTSGTGGGGRYGNFLVTPQSGKIDINQKAFAIDNEVATAGYYSCNLPSEKIHARLTLTEKVGIHQYQFNQDDDAYILIDISSTRITKDKSRCLEAHVDILNDSTLQGYAKYEGGWGGLNRYTTYFFAQFDKACLQKGTWDQNKITERTSTESKAAKDLYLGAFFQFKLNGTNRKVQLKLAISYTSIELAKLFFMQAQGWNFEAFKKATEKKWKSFLSRIQVKGGTAEQRTLFYTAFYKTAMMPRDLSGDNPLWKSSEPHFWDFYTFWDTYRTLNPLLTVIDPEKESQIVRCLLDVYQHKGWLPDAFTAGDYGTIQGGSNADVVVAEAIIKGLKGFDYELAYKALVNDVKNESTNPGSAGRYVRVFNKYGYLPTQNLNGPNNPPCGTSRSIEYSYDDFCISLAAEKLGKTDDYNYYLQRSASIFKTLFHDSLRLFWAKDSDGKWLPDFSTKTNSFSLNGKWQGWMGPFYEGSPLSYSCAAQQDIARIIKAHGGNEAFTSFLDCIFDAGEYESDNEPALNLPWMYIYAGNTHKTYERVRNVINQKFRNEADGWPGNDDAGTISAWYMWATMGIYPIAGQDIYLLTTPTFSSSQFNLENGKKFIIETKNLSAKNSFVQYATLNGKPLNKAWIRHADIMNGGKLILVMGTKPSTWGSNNLPPSFDKVLN
jgi:predicted alpha-1,2-mannosidase